MRCLVFLVVCFIVSCINKKSPLESLANNIEDTGLIFEFLDTIKKHENANNYLARYDSPLSVFYKGNTNNLDFAVFALADSFLAFYQKADSRWKVTDTSEFKFYAHDIKQVDLNGDKFNDIRISCHCAGAAGNEETLVYIYYPHINSFVHNEYYDLYNVRYDAKRNRVQSWFYTGMNHQQ